MFEHQYALIKGIDKKSYDFQLLSDMIRDIFMKDNEFKRLYCMNPKNIPPNEDIGHNTLGNEHVYTDRVPIGLDKMFGTSTNECFDVATDTVTEKLRKVTKELILSYSEYITGEQKTDIEIDSSWVVIVDKGGYVATHTHVKNSGTITLSLHDSGTRTVTLVNDGAPFKENHEFPDEKKFDISCESGDFLILRGDVNHCVPTNTECQPLIVIDFRYI